VLLELSPSPALGLSLLAVPLVKPATAVSKLKLVRSSTVAHFCCIIIKKGIILVNTRTLRSYYNLDRRRLLFTSPSIHQSIHPPIRRPISSHPHIHISWPTWLNQSINQSINQSVNQSQSIYLSTQPASHPSPRCPSYPVTLLKHRRSCHTVLLSQVI